MYFGGFRIDMMEQRIMRSRGAVYYKIVAKETFGSMEERHIKERLR
jgi:hypothetical protein